MLHKWQVAIVWKLDKSQGNRVGRGSGLLISRDLVLTAAHNFYYEFLGKMHQVDINRVNLYPGQCGQLSNPYKIKEVYIPKEYQQTQNTFYDYALVRLAKRYQTDSQEQFLPLSYNFRDEVDSAKLAIYGYPD